MVFSILKVLDVSRVSPKDEVCLKGGLEPIVFLVLFTRLSDFVFVFVFLFSSGSGKVGSCLLCESFSTSFSKIIGL